MTPYDASTGQEFETLMLERDIDDALDETAGDDQRIAETEDETEE